MEILLGSGLGSRVVGRVGRDGTVYAGSGWGDTGVGRVEGDGDVFLGKGLGEQYRGRLDPNGKLYAGPRFGERLVGTVDGQQVFSGDGLGRQLIGAVTDGAPWEAGAVLLVLFAEELAADSADDDADADPGGEKVPAVISGVVGAVWSAMRASDRGAERPDDQERPLPAHGVAPRTLDELVDAGPEALASQIAPFLRDRDETVRSEATQYLRSLGPEGIVSLAERLCLPEWQVRDEAAWLLGLIGRPEAVAPLVVALADGDSDVLYSICDSLTVYRDPRARSALTQASERARDHAPLYVRLALLNALSASGQDGDDRVATYRKELLAEAQAFKLAGDLGRSAVPHHLRRFLPPDDPPSSGPLKTFGQTTSSPGTIRLRVRPSVPPHVERQLLQVRRYITAPEIVDESGTGLRDLYRTAIIDAPELNACVERYRRLNFLWKRGRFIP